MAGILAGGGVLGLALSGASLLVLSTLGPVIVFGSILLVVAIEAIREGL